MKKSIFRAVCLALVLLLTVAALTGCGASGVSTTEYLGTYSTDVTSLIPFYLPDTTGKKVISNVIDGLIETDRFGSFVPSLAESWEHNADYSVWTFHLRDGLKWSDGSDLTAEDFVYSWQGQGSRTRHRAGLCGRHALCGRPQKDQERYVHHQERDRGS